MAPRSKWSALGVQGTAGERAIALPAFVQLSSCMEFHMPLETPARRNWPVSQRQALGPPEDPALSGIEGPPHSRALKLWCIQCILLYQIISRPSSHITSIGISLAVNKGFKAGQSLAWQPEQVLQEGMSIHQHCSLGRLIIPVHLSHPCISILTRICRFWRQQLEGCII